jgi:hypothetical protein
VGVLAVAGCLLGALGQADAAAGAAVHAGATASASTTLAQPTATQPTELIALEQKMQALQVTSEQLNLTEAIALHTAKHPTAKTETLVTVTGAERLSPAAGTFTVSSLGGPKIQARLVGGNYYLKEPSISRHDGGRPWVREPLASADSSLGVNPAAPVGSNATGGATGPFAALIDDLGQAETIESLGTQTVDGQDVTVFAATAALAKLGLYSPEKLGELSQQGATTARIELFIAASGLPVETQVSIPFKGGKTEVIVTSVITALNVPVSVQAPPANRTIGEKLYNRIAAKELKKSLKKLEKAAARHRRGRT